MASSEKDVARAYHEDIINLLAELKKKKIKVRLLTEVSERTEEVLRAIDIPIKYTDLITPIFSHFVIADRSELLLFIKSSKPSGNESAIWTNSETFMMESTDWENMVFVTNYTDENGIQNYREVAILAEADFSQLAHFVVFLGWTLSTTPVKYKLTINYYPTLTLMPRFCLMEGMIYDPIKHKAVEEIEDPDLARLHEIALIRFANIYYELKRSQADFSLHG